MKIYDPTPGESISTTCDALALLATQHDMPSQATFNGIVITASPGMSASELERKWRSEVTQRRAKYEASPEYRQRIAEAKQRAADKRTALQTALRTAGPMECANEAAWQRAIAANVEAYGKRILRYAEEWARLMQVRLAKGAAISDCASELSHVADDDGITGYMYGAAVALLAKTWKHGEALRQWHNATVQIRDEGDMANQSGGVLNPTLLVLSCNE